MARHIEVTPLGRTIEGTQYVAKTSYRVRISEDGTSVVVEARITEGDLEKISDPEAHIKNRYTTQRPALFTYARHICCPS
jgi:hypothetical protein